MFAAKQIFLGRCAKAAWQNPYVTDGLVAMWDGEWNVAGGIHDPNATVWSDLTGNLADFALTEHGTWGENFLQMDGAGAAAVCDKVFPYAGILTVECVVRTTTAVAGATVFNLSPGYLTNGYYYMTRELSWGTNASGAGYTMCGINKLNNVSRVCYVAQPGGDLAFSGCYANGGPICTAMTVNGVAQTSTTLNHGAAANTSAATIGARAPALTSLCSAGRLYTLRLYSRILTAAEIAANNAINRERFNLP